MPVFSNKLKRNLVCPLKKQLMTSEINALSKGKKNETAVNILLTQKRHRKYMMRRGMKKYRANTFIKTLCFNEMSNSLLYFFFIVSKKSLCF